MNSIEYKHVTVAFSDAGSGKALVLLHGFLENKGMWNSISSALSSKYRVIAIDLLGHGNTGCLGYVHTMEDNADVVHAVLSHLKIRKATAGGHSMGGYVALALAEKHPQLVNGLMLINSTAKSDSDDRKNNRDRAIIAVKQNHTPFVRMAIANLFSEENRNRLAADIEHTRDEALKTPLQGIVATLEGMKIRPDRQKVITGKKHPVLLVLGEKDPVLSYEDTVGLAKISGVKLITFPDGHMSPIENNAELTQVMANFMDIIS